VLHTFRLSRLCLWFEGLICHACLVLARRSFSSESAMRVVHSHRRVLRCDRSLSSESAIIVLWIWFGMAIPWYRFLNERVTFSIAFVCPTTREPLPWQPCPSALNAGQGSRVGEGTWHGLGVNACPGPEKKGGLVATCPHMATSLTSPQPSSRQLPAPARHRKTANTDR